jgi:hypothetical protein
MYVSMLTRLPRKLGCFLPPRQDSHSRLAVTAPELAEAHTILFTATYVRMKLKAAEEVWLLSTSILSYI